MKEWKRASGNMNLHTVYLMFKGCVKNKKVIQIVLCQKGGLVFFLICFLMQYNRENCCLCLTSLIHCQSFRYALLHVVF
jgi:hypothetical protein